jgi:hypothetical protein
MKHRILDFILVPAVLAIFAVFAIICYLSGRSPEDGEDE